MSAVTSNTSLEQTTRVIALRLLVFLSLAAATDTLTGKVVKITDGDTLYVRDPIYKEHKIRLAGIDALALSLRPPSDVNLVVHQERSVTNPTQTIVNLRDREETQK